MNIQMCPHTQCCQDGDHYLTCLLCGCVVDTIYNPSEMQLYEDYCKAPLYTPYTRRNRFRNMLDSICLGLEFPNDKHMFKHLLPLDPSSPADIIRGMKSSGLVDKRFCSLHVFMKCFCPHKLTPNLKEVARFHKMKLTILKTFTNIEFMLQGGRFLNYRFVVDVILWLYDFNLWRCFVKPLKCPKRVTKCVEIFNSLQITYRDKVVVIPDTYLMSPKSLFLQE
jgi:hypothetical protein